VDIRRNILWETRHAEIADVGQQTLVERISGQLLIWNVCIFTSEEADTLTQPFVLYTEAVL
jgi:hypothetical protein